MTDLKELAADLIKCKLRSRGLWDDARTEEARSRDLERELCAAILTQHVGEFVSCPAGRCRLVEVWRQYVAVEYGGTEHVYEVNDVWHSAYDEHKCLPERGDCEMPF